MVFNDHPDAAGTILGGRRQAGRIYGTGGNIGISPASRFRILSSRAKHYERKFVVQNNMQNTVMLSLKHEQDSPGELYILRYSSVI